jgi:hypothetical protein
MKVTVLGSCRQDSIYKMYDVTNIRDNLTYPHYSKEVLQAIKFCKGLLNIPNDLTQYIFRSGIFNKCQIDYKTFANDFNSTDLFIIEIASRISYEYNGYYAHHILTEEQHQFKDRLNIIQRNLTDEEIEKDILEIRELLNGKPFIIVGHICTRKTGKRYELLQILKKICNNHTIPFFNPQEELQNEDSQKLYTQENLLSHYTPYGHEVIAKLYKSFIDKVIETDNPSINILKPYVSIYSKYRCGPKEDGGYVIADLDSYDALFTCGISNDIRFEIEFLKKYPIPCYAYDGTIEELPDLSQPLIKFNKLNIDANTTNKTTNLSREINEFNNIFLKMDIETFEFRWFRSLTINQLKKFKQIVVEIHYPFTLYPFNHLDKQLSVHDKLIPLKTLLNTHTLIHLHGNNCCGFTFFQGKNLPNVLECTFVRKDIQDGGDLNKSSIPSDLDYPNLNQSDIFFNLE